MQDIPEWFTRALADKPQDKSLTVLGAGVRYLTWGDPGKPALLLVHGGSAHAHWWDFLAPLLTHSYYIIAPNLTGHGDSDHRQEYSDEVWARELRAVVRAERAVTPVLVGHSMGGVAVAAAAAMFPQDFAGCIVVDSPAARPKYRPSNDTARLIAGIAPFKTREEAVARFRLLPYNHKQALPPDYIMTHVAATSIKPSKGGFVWKFDPLVFHKMQPLDFAAMYQRITLPVGFIRGEFSTLTHAHDEAALTRALGRRIPFKTLAGTHHHLFLERPKAFLRMLENMLVQEILAPPSSG